MAGIEVFRPSQLLEERDNGFVKIEGMGQPYPFSPQDEAFLLVPPEVTIGNHRHKRMEAILGLNPGALLYWLEESGELNSVELDREHLVVVGSFVPHAIHNAGDAEAHLVEWASITPKYDSAEKIQVYP